MALSPLITCLCLSRSSTHIAAIKTNLLSLIEFPHSSSACIPMSSVNKHWALSWELTAEKYPHFMLAYILPYHVPPTSCQYFAETHSMSMLLGRKEQSSYEGKNFKMAFKTMATFSNNSPLGRTHLEKTVGNRKVPQAACVTSKPCPREGA